MSLNVTVTGTPILEGIPPSSISAQMRADDGDAGFGGFLIDDPTATVTTTGHRVLVVEETACVQPRIFMGYLTERVLSRSEDRALVAGDDARLHDVGSVDLNAVFNFRTLHGSSVKRPAETMEDRLTWLLGSAFLAPFVEDTGFVSYYALQMDEADYTGATPATVLQDLVERKSDTTLTYFAFWDATASAVGLYFGGEGAGIGESTLSISNVLSDVNGSTIFAPDSEAKLRRTPEEVYSEVVVEYSRGTKRIFRRRADTETAYGIARGTTIQRPYTQSSTTAQSQAERWLTKHSVEQDEITVAIIVPPASAGLALAGQRIDVKFTHLPGYETWTSMLIVTSTVTPWDDTATQYRVELVLRLPVASSSAPVCTTCEGNFFYGIVPTTGSGTNTGQTVQDAAEATDCLYWDESYGAYFAAGVLGAGTWIREWDFALGGDTSFQKITLMATSGPNGEIGVTPESLQRMSIIFGGTEYDYTYATGLDVDVWPITEQGDIDATATWNFGGVVTGSTLTVRETFTMPGLGYVEQGTVLEILGCAASPDETSDLGPVPGEPVLSSSNPTVNDDAADGYQVGQVWINTTTGAVFVLTDSTTGAAVWTAIGGGAPATTVESETTWGITPSVGSDSEYARQDHTHGSPANPASGAAISALGFVGELLISDSPSSPLVFADILQNEATTDLLYADV